MKVLIVGGGIAGTSLAILLARAGVTVELAERHPTWTALGSGITLQGNALRVLRDLGVWDRVKAEGYAFDSVGIRTPTGKLLFESDDIKSGGPDLPASLGMYRPALCAILVEAAQSAGAELTLGRTVTSVDPVAFDDGTTGEYDLVVGADGIRSSVRRMIGIGTEPRPVGMGAWRAHVPRPAQIQRTELMYGGPCYIAGYCPTGENSIYAYLVDKVTDQAVIPRERLADMMRELAQPYGGAWEEIKPTLTDTAPINYTHFEWLLVDEPWHRGNVLLLGDAVHACPPTLAQGAAQCLEDAAVLAELLLARGGPDQTLFEEFRDRRIERVRTVVETSLQIARWQMEPGPGADVPGAMARVAAAMTDRP
ncbi:FAD-dependent monooxygenase [Actinomadura sp. WMMB 499]|uniref:FAD-dependent monooxygenase n=1 Tax=Actinomadura sp. WMMB 499 TaxID=1219491 RepID=UPI001246D534|nr:FAD-dependent monooxygenase [Actinomadura sp. WMMB 499]QFG22411.1 NAD(P)-binding protein [Actinomadura sp. WMMB 499]